MKCFCNIQYHSFPLVLALFTLSGILTVGNQVSLQTLLRTAVADYWCTRVFGTYVATLSLFLLVGTALGRILATLLGILPLLDLGCALFLCASLVAILLFIPTFAPTFGPLQRKEVEERSTLPD
jgi:hypothetical protein